MQGHTEVEVYSFYSVVLVSAADVVNVFIAVLPLLFKIRCSRQLSSALFFAHTNFIVLQLKTPYNWKDL